MLPAAAQLDRLAPPDAGSAVKVEKVSRPVAGGLLDHKMAVEHDCLQTRQQIVRAVDVGPAHLCTAYDWIGKVMNQLAQEIGLRHKVRIEDGDQFALGALHSVFQSAGFESGAIVAMDVMNIETLRGIILDRRAPDVHRLIG